jgi:hypothetical protein
MDRCCLAEWFDSKEGKKKAAVSKPIITPEHKQKRVEWATERLCELAIHFGNRSQRCHGNETDDPKDENEPHLGASRALLLLFR